MNVSWDAACCGERVSPRELHEDGTHSTAQHKIAFNPGRLEETEIILAVTFSLAHAERVSLEMRA